MQNAATSNYAITWISHVRTILLSLCSVTYEESCYTLSACTWRIIIILCLAFCTFRLFFIFQNTVNQSLLVRHNWQTVANCGGTLSLISRRPFIQSTSGRCPVISGRILLGKILRQAVKTLQGRVSTTTTDNTGRHSKWQQLQVENCESRKRTFSDFEIGWSFVKSHEIPFCRICIARIGGDVCKEGEGKKGRGVGGFESLKLKTEVTK